MQKKQAIIIIFVLALLGSWQVYKQRNHLSKYVLGSEISTTDPNKPDPVAELRKELKAAAEKIAELERDKTSTGTKLEMMEKNLETITLALASIGKRLTDIATRTDNSEKELVDVADWLNELANKCTKLASTQDKMSGKVDAQLAQLLKSLAEDKQTKDEQIARLSGRVNELRENHAAEQRARKEQERERRAKEEPVFLDPEPIPTISPKIKLERVTLQPYKDKTGEYIKAVSKFYAYATHQELMVVFVIRDAKGQEQELKPGRKIKPLEEGQEYENFTLYIPTGLLPERYKIALKFSPASNPGQTIALSDWRSQDEIAGYKPSSYAATASDTLKVRRYRPN